MCHLLDIVLHVDIIVEKKKSKKVQKNLHGKKKCITFASLKKINQKYISYVSLLKKANQTTH